MSICTAYQKIRKAPSLFLSYSGKTEKSAGLTHTDDPFGSPEII